MCVKYGIPRKDESLLRQAAQDYGFGADVKGCLWKMPARYVGPYAEYDAKSPLLIFQKQLKSLEQQGLLPVFELESKLLPILWLMRKRGIRIDVEKATRLSKDLLAEECRVRQEMNVKYGQEIDEWSGGQIAMVCDRLNIKYPHTQHGNPSFTADFIEGTSNPFFDSLSELRELNSMRSKFVDGWLLKNVVGEFVHPQWRQCATDEGGTRTGRMAAANPNPQQVPAGKYRKTGKPNPFGQQIRGCFIPHDKDLRWAKYDYKAQEPRILTHFATKCNCTGAILAAMKYKSDKDFDIYQLMVEAAGIDRRPAKDCYLGRCYGMGKAKLAAKFNRTESEAEQILKKFDEGVPFVKEMADLCSNAAERRGYIRTLLGRRRHFTLWEPVDSYNMRKRGIDCMPVRENVANSKWSGERLRRSQTHKALNALIQGSAADMTKAAMVMTYEELETFPYMQVHDELAYGVTGQSEAEDIQQRIEGCVDMEVPIAAELTLGDSWK
jgi:DNA polymerase I-like protein with 3'-5' exonuclease and polymerase domains